MGQQKSDRTHAARDAKRAKADEQDRLAAESHSRRTAKSSIATSAIEQLTPLVGSLREKTVKAKALASHLQGFYEEVDKLAKNRTLVAATDLGVEQANDIVRQAKQLIEADPYLDRVKELVPAGDNPVYPDVLLTVRAVQQSLDRFLAGLEAQTKRLATVLLEAKTIRGALQFYLEQNETPSTEDVEAIIGGRVSADWFVSSNFSNDDHFNMARLDRCSLELYLSAARVVEAGDE